MDNEFLLAILAALDEQGYSLTGYFMHSAQAVVLGMKSGSSVCWRWSVCSPGLEDGVYGGQAMFAFAERCARLLPAKSTGQFALQA